MAIYSTFFLCSYSELCLTFRGWVPPLEKPVSRVVVNPFTRKKMTIETREPNWDEIEVELSHLSSDHRIVVGISGDYSNYLEERRQACIQGKSHWSSKNLTSVELEPLISSVVDDEKLEVALYAPPDLSVMLYKIPDSFVKSLCSTDLKNLNLIAHRWSDNLSSPSFTYSTGDESLMPDFSSSDALNILESIIELARNIEHSQSMYVLIEA